MRRLTLVLLVAVIAFSAGTFGANGTLSRLLADAGVQIGAGATPNPTATAPAVSIPVQVATRASVPTATLAQATGAPTVAVPSATPLPSATSRPTDTPSATPSATPTRLPTPPAPISLIQKAPGGATLAARAYAGAGGLALHVLAPSFSMDMRAQVEVRPAGEPFRGVATGAAPVVMGVATIPLHGLPAGRYHWQARLTAAGGNGAWTPFAQGALAFGVQLVPPTAPLVSSPSHPRPNVTYARSIATFAWSMPTDSSGISGYGWRLDTDPRGVARTAIRTRAQSISVGGLDSGAYYFHVRAVDGVGNWGPNATVPIRIDVTPPTITHTVASGYYFNPAVERLRLNFTLTKVATITVGIYDHNSRLREIAPKGLLPAGVPLHVSWDGRDDAGRVVAPGCYNVWLRATDRLGNQKSIPWGCYTVSSKRIVISLTQQRLWAYDGNNLLLTTLVTTGNKALPTPTGIFHIMFARSPFTFISPWPKGSLYYYAPVKVNYALYFHDYGFYIHDSPWRTFYGPGSNATTGTPGQNYTGTHGCVNVPEGIMKTLYKWATPGTAVQINQ